MSASGGKGKSNSASGINLVPYVQMFEQESRPVRQNLFSQMQEALTTGGVGARAPIVGTATNATQNAIARSLTTVRDQFSRAGLGNTPFAARALAEGTLQGAQALKDIPTQWAQGLIGQAGQSAGNIMGSVMSALASQSRGSSKSFNQSASL